MRWGQQGGRRAVVTLAALLVVLLILHHPLMGRVPMDTAHASAVPDHGSAVVIAAADDGSMSMVSLAGHKCSCCPACETPCPLMHGVAPGRLTLRSSAPRADWTDTAAPFAAVHTPPAFRQCTRGLAAAATRRAPSSSARRAVLQVFLL
jgi:hypothetical protein